MLFDQSRENVITLDNIYENFWLINQNDNNRFHKIV